MSKKVVKRNGEVVDFDIVKICKAVQSAFESVNQRYPKTLTKHLGLFFESMKGDILDVEKIQDKVEEILMDFGYFKVAKSYILYREQHKESRAVKERVDYIRKYMKKGTNAATASEVDSNANVQNKNIATLEAEVPKSQNININRYFVTDKLKELYGDEAPDYVGDLDAGIIYKHDESSSPIPKPYCVAVNLYPFLQNGTSSLDKLKNEAPQNLSSFVGQFGNLAFLLSSQFLGAIAFGEFFNVFNYYCIKEFGEKYREIENAPVYDTLNKRRNIRESIIQAFQGIVHTINQPAGNRSFQSPFTNISYYDENYWKALFEEFVYPDGTKPEWEDIDYLQRLFMKWFNAERKKTLLTFPVETVAMLSDGTDIIDKNYKDFVAEMYAEGHSFFTYISDNADSLSSCCRLKNKLEKSEFNFTSGLTGVATGSKSVITLNLNRITQNSVKKWKEDFDITNLEMDIEEILKRVYKYHTAYNEILKDFYEADMLPVYSEGFISLNQQFLTVGINGLNEAAEFLGYEINDNEDYQRFCNTITSAISNQNKLHTTKELKFNTEFVPAEGLGIKNYDRDTKDGYWTPADRNCYNSYFYKPDDTNISVLEKFRLHGKRYVDLLDGGVALHCNLDEHLSKEQYSKLIEFAVQEGTSYFTFNIPNSQCDDCGYIEKVPLCKCPKCGSENVTQWTRIIGYLRPIKGFSAGRIIEAGRRIYHHEVS